MPWLRKAFDVLILLLVLAGPACYLPWARVLLLPLILVGAPIGSASSGSSSPVVFPAPSVHQGSQNPKGIRVAALYWAAGNQPRSSNNKEQPASLSSYSNDQLPTDSPSSSIAAEPFPSLRLNGSPRPCSISRPFLLQPVASHLAYQVPLSITS